MFCIVNTARWTESEQSFWIIIIPNTCQPSTHLIRHFVSSNENSQVFVVYLDDTWSWLQHRRDMYVCVSVCVQSGTISLCLCVHSSVSCRQPSNWPSVRPLLAGLVGSVCVWSMLSCPVLSVMPSSVLWIHTHTHSRHSCMRVHLCMCVSALPPSVPSTPIDRHTPTLSPWPT